MRTKLTSVLLTQPLPDGDENNVSALIPAGLPVQESSKPGQFEISYIAHDDSRVDRYTYEFWHDMGILLERDQVEDGYPTADKKTQLKTQWMLVAAVVIGIYFPPSIPLSILVLLLALRRHNKRMCDEWGPAKLPPE